MDEDGSNVLEVKTDKLTISCIYIHGCNNPKILETLTTQFSLGNKNFPWEQEQCCSIHSTAFSKQTKQPNNGKDDDNGRDNK